MSTLQTRWILSPASNAVTVRVSFSEMSLMNTFISERRPSDSPVTSMARCTLEFYHPGNPARWYPLLNSGRAVSGSEIYDQLTRLASAHLLSAQTMLQAREYHKYNEQIRQWITADGTLLKALVHTTSMPLRLYWQPVIPHIHHAIRADLSDEQLARFYTSIRPATGRYSYQSRLCLVSVWFPPVDARSEGRWTALDENSGYLVKAYEVYNALRYLAHRGQLKSSNVMYAIRHVRMDCVTKGRTTNEPRVLLGDLRHFESPNPTPDAAISDAALFESVACTAPENASDQGPNWQWVQLRGPDEVRVEVTISNLRLFSTDFLQAPAPTVTEVCNRLPHCELRVLAPAGQWSSFSSCGILAKKRELHEYFNKRYQIGRSHSATVFLCIGHKMQKYNRSTGERSNDGGILVAGLQPEIQ